VNSRNSDQTRARGADAEGMNWQQANIQAAAAYLRDRLAAGATDTRTRSIYEGLLDVLDPSRRAARLRREVAETAKAVPVQTNRERRARSERRVADRRTVDLGPPDGVERRSGPERRRSRDRRSER
jgi:hypothetical protein